MEKIIWHFEPSVVLGLAIWSISYALAIGPLRVRQRWGPAPARWRQLAFHLGTLSVLLALGSPLDDLADEALFSAHMAQHMLLTFVGPPLWLLGTPGWLARRLAPAPWLNAATHPVIAFTVFTSIMWVWHVPAMYAAALEDQTLHIVEHLTFMGSALLGWWPILGPDDAGRLRPAYRLAYLIPSMFACTALAGLITLSSRDLYPFYADTTRFWGLSPLDDQQLGGLGMWLPGDMVYVALTLWTARALLESGPATLERAPS